MKHVKAEEGVLSRQAPQYKPSPVAGIMLDVNPLHGGHSPTRSSASRAGKQVVSSRPATGAQTSRVQAAQRKVQQMIAEEHVRRKKFEEKLARMEEEIKRIKAQEIRELEEQLNALKED